MISDERPQNIIVAVTIIVGVISAFSLMNTATYYTGTVQMINGLEITFEELVITNLDETLTNISIDIPLRLRFNIYCPSQFDGKVRITTIAATLIVNDDELSYISLLKNLNVDDGALTPHYNRTFSLTATVHDRIDKFTLRNATVADTWNISIVFRYFYRLFNSRADEVNFLLFNTTQVTLA